MYRGDSFKRTLKVYLGDGTKYQFVPGDRVKCGFALNSLYLEKTIEFDEPTDEVIISYPGEDMESLKPGTYIFEIQITTSTFTKTYQQKITVDKDFIYE